MHTPVLLQETVDALNIKEGGSYIDATAGEGGHTAEILGRGGRVLAIDRDAGQIERLAGKMAGKTGLTAVNGNFSDIEKLAVRNGFVPADGIVFDFGLSMRQLAESGLGFSYKNRTEPLDMRLDRQGAAAADLLNTMSQEEIADMIAVNSEELKALDIAAAIVRLRRKRPIATVGDLTEAITDGIRHQDDKVKSRVFQALRVEVNREFENLRAGLEGGLKILGPQGRMAVITFHSLEDRLVKKFARENGLHGDKAEPVSGTRPFERSAKLRIIYKI